MENKKISRVCWSKIKEPKNWNNKLWLRVEFGIFVPFNYKDSIVRIICCHDQDDDDGVLGLFREYGVIREYNLKDMSDIFSFDIGSIKNFDSLYKLIYKNLLTLIHDAYGLNGWFCKYIGVDGYNILKKRSNTKISAEYFTQDLSAISITVCIKHVP